MLLEVSQSLDNAFGLGQGRGRHQGRELVPADPGGDIGLAADLLEQVRDPYDHLISTLMAVIVVDRLELVDIDHDDGEGDMVAVGVGDGLNMLLVEEAAVVDSGKAVHAGHFFQLAHQKLALCHGRQLAQEDRDDLM